MNVEQTAATDIAVIGLACRFPGANTPSQFWALLQEGREARTELGDEALRVAGVPNALLNDPDYVKAGMFLHGMEFFDAGFFGFSPLDAKIMDPQHRHFLECAWEALEDAAYDPARYEGAIGVFAGSGHNAYLPYNLLTNPELVAEVGFFLLRHTGNDKDFLTTRASYCFDLKGPSVNVQTACSTSLVAVHNAAQSLINGECDMALAGGVTIEMPHRQGYLYKESEILSRDGHCRPFDASAGGTVFGSGVGILVLKRLDDALTDGDHIHAVIKSSAINNDGAGKVSYLAPSVDGQAAAVHEALAIGDIDPTSVTYVECHGTGTPLGDPIEVAALTQAYGVNNPKRRYCGIGSVKSNIGHLDTAAGAASLIKVILALQHRQLPATLHFRAPNAAIDFANSPFYVNAQLSDWNAPTPRRAGVSSLGVGGTNAHIIVQEAPAAAAVAPVRALQLLLFSARSESSLLRSRDRFSRFFEETPELSLADAAYTLAVGRRAFRKRAFAIAGDRREAVAVFEDAARFTIAEAPDSPRKVAFMFAGGGAQYPNMGRDLYETEPVYRAIVDECLLLLRNFVDFDLKPLLYPPRGQEQEAAVALERPSRTLPALFITQYAQAQLWRHWGIEPAALIGHSMGENTAACLAGVISLRDALGLVALRGRLFESVSDGSMLSVEIGEAELLPLLGDELSLGAINAPALMMASGPKAALARLEQTLAERDIGYRRIHIEVAAHSLMLEGILKPFGDYLRSIRLQAPSIPFISNLTGAWITPEQAASPDYWVKHLRQTVRFADGIEKLLGSGQYALLEVGPGRTLVSLAGLQPTKRADQTIVASLRHPDDDTPDMTQMLGTLGRLWQANVAVDWATFYRDQGRQRVSLPTYAFDHARHWVEPGTGFNRGAGGRDDTERADEISHWLYQPVWQRAAKTVPNDLNGRRVLVLQGHNRFAAEIVAALRAVGTDLRIVSGGSALTLDADALQLRWTRADDYVHLAEALGKLEWQPTHILSLLPLDLQQGIFDQQQRALVFDSLFHLAQVVANEDWRPLRWLVVASGSVQVGADKLSAPLGALALGPIRVLPHEFPEWRCTLLDIADASASVVLHELADSGDEHLVAARGNVRYVQRHQSRVDTNEPQRAVRDNGVYLITGGSGGLGLVAAAALAQSQPNITLYLLARRPLPERQYWDALIADHAPEADTLSQLIKLERGGTRIRLHNADVADKAAIRVLAERIQSEAGALHGIVHTAGAVADALLLTKEFADAEIVLRSKLVGTLVLDEIFAERDLDFIVLYSSTSAFFGLPGQIDYTAANAFLDAFAQARTEAGINYISINWPAWKQTGMAATLVNGARYLPAGRPVSHPLLDRCIREHESGATYATLFSAREHWLLSEHRIKDGPALVPGAGFIELARAAFAEKLGRTASAITIRDAIFELPFFVENNAYKVLTVNIDDNRFTITSDSFGETGVHAHGSIALAERGEMLDITLDIAAIKTRCQRGMQTFDAADHHPFLAFGDRWRVLKQVHCGEREALIELEVPAAWQHELEDIALHPAVLDMATAGAQIIVDGYKPQNDLYVPIGYQFLQFNGRLPSAGYSHVVYRPGVDDDEIIFDVCVCDRTGTIALRVDGFTMRRIPDVNSFRRALPASSSDIDSALKRTLELGIDNREGTDALLHIIEHGLGPQTAVSPYRLSYLQSELLQPLAVERAVQQEPMFDADADDRIIAIEAALHDCPAIEKVIVRAFRNETDECRFVAFFLPNFDSFVTQGELRRYAREQLAEELVPQQWVEVDEFTVDAHGAIDRKVLLDPLAPRDNYLAPRTTVEKGLARIWHDALGVERVGLGDNFFDLGGHSLLSTRVIVQIYKKFGVRLDQATMVLHTLEQVSREISEQTGGDADNGATENIAPVKAESAQSTDAFTDKKPTDKKPTDKKKSLLKSWLGGKR